MYERIATSDDTLAVRLGETLTADEIDALYAEAEKALQGRERLNYFVDATAWSHLAPDTALHALKQRMLHLGWYNRFQRVAVVTENQALKTMLSAMDWITPVMDVKAFGPAEADEALRWCEKG